MRGFIYERHHYTYDEQTELYWNDDMRGMWVSFHPSALPKDIEWDEDKEVKKRT